MSQHATACIPLGRTNILRMSWSEVPLTPVPRIYTHRRSIRRHTILAAPQGRARVATDEEAIEFYEDIRTAKERHEQNEAAKRIQVMVIPASSLPVRGEDRK